MNHTVASLAARRANARHATTRRIQRAATRAQNDQTHRKKTMTVTTPVRQRKPLWELVADDATLTYRNAGLPVEDMTVTGPIFYRRGRHELLHISTDRSHYLWLNTKLTSHPADTLAEDTVLIANHGNHTGLLGALTRRAIVEPLRQVSTDVNRPVWLCRVRLDGKEAE